ncbi:hypothetical protein BG46_17600 [Brucella anthropi]|nr:hypothetical protein BG46_17600 [Brucella anthropi]
MNCRNLLMIDLRHVGVEKGRGLFRRLQHGRNIFLALFQRHHLGIDAVGRSALEDEIEERVEFAIDLFYLCFCGFDGNTRSHPGLVDFPRKFLAKILEQFRLHEMLVQAIQDGGFKCIAPDVEPIVTGTLVSRIGAAEQILGNHRVAATAAAALDKAGKQMLWPASVAEEVRRRG